MSAANPSRGSIDHAIARIREEYLNDPFFHTIRREAEMKAKEMLDKFHVMSPTDKDIGKFLDYMNTENIKGKTGHTRFGRHFTNILKPHICKSPDAFKEWICMLYSAEENELKNTLNNFFRREPIKGAGTLLPTFVLYLRKPAAFSIWTKSLEKNLEMVFPCSITPGKSQSEQYEHFNSRVFDLLATPFRLEPQEVDLVLSQVPSYLR